MVINHSEELASKEEVEKQRDIDINWRVAGSSPIDESKKSDEDETSSEDIQATKEAERTSEEIISVDVPPMTETASVILELVNDHPIRQESKEREVSLDEVRVLYFQYVVETVANKAEGSY